MPEFPVPPAAIEAGLEGDPASWGVSDLSEQEAGAFVALLKDGDVAGEGRPVGDIALPAVPAEAVALTEHVTNPRGAAAAVVTGAPLIGAAYIDWAADQLYDGVAIAQLRDLARQLREGT